MPDNTANASRELKQYVYTGVTEAQRPTLVADLWRDGAIRVDVVKKGATYTVTATFDT